MSSADAIRAIRGMRTFLPEALSKQVCARGQISVAELDCQIGNLTTQERGGLTDAGEATKIGLGFADEGRGTM